MIDVRHRCLLPSKESLHASVRCDTCDAAPVEQLESVYNPLGVILASLCFHYFIVAREDHHSLTGTKLN